MKTKLFLLIGFLWFGWVIFISNSYAYDITDNFSIGAILAGAYQYQWFEFGENNALDLTGGIIDSTAYIGVNAFANNEYTQFMNAALVNAPTGFFPSYDIGGAAEWQIGNWDITVLGMNVGENDDGNNYNYAAGQISYRINTFIGEGNYRLVIDGTSKDFLDEDGNAERLLAASVSFDQELGDIFGAWIRMGWQDDRAVIDYDYLLSGGLDITGKWYGREEDNIGIG